MLYLLLCIALSILFLKNTDKDVKKIGIYSCIAGGLAIGQFLLAHDCGYSLSSAKETVFQVVWLSHICYMAKGIAFDDKDRKEAVVEIIQTVLCILLSSCVMFSYSKGVMGAEGNRYIRLLFSHEFVFLVLFRLMFLVWIYAKKVTENLSKNVNLAFYSAVVSLSAFVGAFTSIYAATGDSILKMDKKWILFTAVLMLLIQIIFMGLTHKSYRGLSIYHVVVWLMGAIYYYILEFRGTPLTFADMTAVGTALEVSGQYQVVLSNTIVFSLTVALLFMMLSLIFGSACTKEKKFFSVHLVTRLVCVVLSGFILVNFTYNMDWKEKLGIRLGNWKVASDYEKYGFPLAFVRSMQQMKIEPPEGYSKEKVKELVEAVPFEKNTDGVKPTIIGIMNESFSDLSVIGELNCCDEIMAYYRSLKDDPHMVEYGYDYVSAYGGGTSSTEFEALTANSMKMLRDVHPYQMMNFATIGNLAGNLKNEGYHTVAIHPNKAENYRRKTVYDQMGFDEFVDITDFEGAETFGIRVSDKADYQKVIETYESFNGEPGFIFNVTMQNHGGYTTANLLESIERVKVDEKYAGYDDLVCFQTMIRESNEALKDLLAYFESVDQPVLLYFFGDHQPKLDENFLNDLTESGKKEEETNRMLEEKKYQIPYFIWANYDVEKDPDLPKDENGMNITSPFYLSASINRYSGAAETPYTNYVFEMRKDIPAMNFNGIMEKDQKWKSYGKASEKYDEYLMVEYAGLYDSYNISYLFFTERE